MNSATGAMADQARKGCGYHVGRRCIHPLPDLIWPVLPPSTRWGDPRFSCPATPRCGELLQRYAGTAGVNLRA